MILKKSLFIAICTYILFLGHCYAQTTSIPDENFEQALIDLDIDTDGVINGEVLTADISGVLTLIIPSKEISDLTGIEDFSSLTELNCDDNKLATLDVNQNKNLTKLSCRFNILTYLEVTGVPALEILKCENNELPSLNVSQNKNLTLLNCNANVLTNLNVTGADKLTDLECIGNNLGSLDVSNNPELINFRCSDNLILDINVENNLKLEFFYCDRNQLSAIDLSNNPLLLELECYDNQLNQLELSNNTSLQIIKCNDNKILELDLSNLTDLRIIECHNNALINFNLKNGSNTLIAKFDSTNNPDLTCILVDDANYAQLNWTDIDAWTFFSEDCLNVPDPPIALDDAYETLMDNSLIVSAVDGVLSNDFDPQGNVLTAILNANVINGTLTLLPDGSFDYIPYPGFIGMDSFTYSANNGILNSSLATVTIDVKGIAQQSFITIPNGFTPNQDGINDYFKPVYSGMQLVRMEIYNTWGILIFVEENANLAGWNGFIKNKNAENGNYLYKISAISILNEEIIREGLFTLIR